MLQRRPEHLASQTWDVLIIGGGITGACIAWDAAQRGLSVALVDKADFSHATSAAPSKLIHGGLRYLKNLEFGLVRESLQERRVMEVIAPHQVVPLPFLLPAYGWRTQGGLPMLGAAMLLYEGLSYDKGWLEEEAQKLPGFKALSRKQVLNIAPGLPQKGLNGGFIYYDCQMLSPERLTLDFLLSAAEAGATLCNYAEVTDFEVSDACLRGVTVKDVISGQQYDVQARVTVNASGPWADLLLGLMDGEPARKLLRSKGIHIITRRLVETDCALTLATADGRHLFLIPWRGHTLIGTTDVAYKGHPDQFQVTEADITGLLDQVNGLLPEARLTRADVRHFYGGLRPLVEEETQVQAESYKLSRKFEVFDHAEKGLEGFLTVIGGKYTTARLLAEQTVDRIYSKLGLASVACQTAQLPIWGSGPHRHYSDLEASLRQNNPLIDPAQLVLLARHYGQRVGKLLELATQTPGGFQRLGQHEPEIAAQVLYGIRHEMALTLGDILFRRTGLGTLGPLPEEQLQAIIDLMAAELGWDAQRAEAELAAVQRVYTPLSEAVSA